MLFEKISLALPRAKRSQFLKISIILEFFDVFSKFIDCLQFRYFVRYLRDREISLPQYK